MKTWFLNLSLREKQIVFFGGILLSILLTYSLIFAPLKNNVSLLRTKVLNDTKLLAWMQTTNAKIKNLSRSSQPSHALSTSLLTALQENLQNTSFAKNVLQLQQAENDLVEVKLQNIPFDDFSKWLIQFTQENQLQVAEFVATPAKEPGMVSIEVKISV